MATENMLKTALNILETVVAPSIGELKAHAQVTDANFAHQSERMEKGFKSANERMDSGFKSASDRTDIQFKAIISEMQAMRAQMDAAYSKQYSDLLARVAVLEAQMQTKH